MKTRTSDYQSNYLALEHNGESHTAKEWSRITGIPAATIYKRLEIGWSIEKTLTTKNRGIGGLSVSASTEYDVWQGIMKRCYNTAYKRYADYGGRGITVCERWHEFPNFLADMGKRPSPQHSIDRFPNNDGNYEPGNCRWATAIEQANNKRDSHVLTHNGESKTISEWSRIVDIKASIIWKRVNRGWPTHTALTVRPITKGAHRPLAGLDSQIIDAYKSNSSIGDIARQHSVKPSSIRNVLRRNNVSLRSQLEQIALDTQRRRDQSASTHL